MEHSVTITAYFNVLNMDSYPNSDSKFVAYIFIHSSKEAANSIKISVPTLLLPPLKRVPYTILCSSSTELTRRKHKTSIVEFSLPIGSLPAGRSCIPSGPSLSSTSGDRKKPSQTRLGLGFKFTGFSSCPQLTVKHLSFFFI